MSRGQALRALVTERLTAAAEDIFALVERTIAEYEEELSRSKEENQRKQRLLDQAPPQQQQQQVLPHDFKASRQNNEIPDPETAPIKEEPEEQSLNQEEEFPQFIKAPPTTEKILISKVSSLWGSGEKPSRSAEPLSLSCAETMTEFTEERLPKSHVKTTETTKTCWRIKTEADEDPYSQVQINNTTAAAHNAALFTKLKSAAGTRATVIEGLASGTVWEEKYECPFCAKPFLTKETLEMHVRIHTCEKPFTCAVCKKTYSQKDYMKAHMGPHSCSAAASGGSSGATGSPEFNVHYRGKKIHINLSGVSYSSFLAEARERFGIHSNAGVYLTDDTQTQVDADVFTELVEKKPSITLVVVDAPSAPESEATFPCTDVLPPPSRLYGADDGFTPKRPRTDDGALDPKEGFNAWSLPRRDQEEAMPLPLFQAAVGPTVGPAVSAPVAPLPPHKKYVSRVPPEVRKDGVAHVPAWESRQRCKHCKGNRFTHVYCGKCKVHLCLNKFRNCFQAYHVAE